MAPWSEGSSHWISLPYQQESSSSWSKKAAAHSASGEGAEEVEDTSLPFDGTRRKLYMSLLLTSHWLEFSHKAMNSCKGGWEM